MIATVGKAASATLSIGVHMPTTFCVDTIEAGETCSDDTEQTNVEKDEERDRKRRRNI